MTRVNLIGPADDGLHLIVEADAGERFTLAITDELRHAVRYARPKAAPGSEDESTDVLSPRLIQQRIRAGLTAADLAELTGAPLEALEKYEPPVIAERAYVAELARTTRIGHDPSAPLLGELVADRLAARGVDPDAIVWDAWREVDEPWQVAVEFAGGGTTVRALWSFDHTARSLTAEDDESRWLTETELLDVPIPRRHLSAVPSGEDDGRPLPARRPAAPLGEIGAGLEDEAAADNAEPDGTETATTEALLEDLDARRGTREGVLDFDVDDEGDDFEGFGPAARAREADVGFGASMPHPSTQGRAVGDAGAPAAPPKVTPADVTPAAPAPEAKATRRGRASVPSWDEIVFGAKHDQG